MAALQLRTVLVAYEGIFPPAAAKPTVEELREWWETRLGQPPPAAGFVAETAGGVCVGTVWAGRYPDEPSVGVLSRLYVQPERWGTGLGAALHGVAVDALVAGGFTEAVLGVLERNDRARRFYERRGWRPDGTSYEAGGEGSGVIELLYRIRLPSRSL